MRGNDRGKKIASMAPQKQFTVFTQLSELYVVI